MTLKCGALAGKCPLKPEFHFPGTHSVNAQGVYCAKHANSRELILSLKRVPISENESEEEWE